MPAYDRPIQFNGARQEEKRLGTVLIFNCKDAERVQEFLDRLVERGIAEPAIVREFDASYGKPVWYIP